MSISAGIVMMMMMIVVGSREVQERDPVMRFVEDGTRYFRLTKNAVETKGHINQCCTTNLRREPLGQVNVVAFLDPEWYYSYRQAIMLELLEKRLKKSGFSDIVFFVVMPASSLPEDYTESEVEIKTWKEISKSIVESEYFQDAHEMLSNDFSPEKKSIIFLQDTPELGIWENFRVSRDEVAIVDRCGKLTYQVVVPWSILYFPYVTAAILSTYREDPCGPCDESTSTPHNTMDYEKVVKKNTDTFSDPEGTSISLNESTESGSEKGRSTVNSFELNMYKSTVSDSSVSDTETVPTGTTENVKINHDTFITATFTSNEEGINLETNHDNRRSEPVLELESIHGATELQQQVDKSLPLRLILYAPHLHQENGSLKKYTHLVLKNGNPDYHGHFHSTCRTANEEPTILEKSDPAIVDNQQLKEYVYSKDESPGLYGEVADYWRIADEESFNNNIENTELIDYDYAAAQDAGSHAQ